MSNHRTLRMSNIIIIIITTWRITNLFLNSEKNI